MVRGHFGTEDVVVVGDRGILTAAYAEVLAEAGVEFVSALKSAQICKLARAGDLQLTLFDERNLAEISSEAFPGERLVGRRNPAVAAERKRRRAELLIATGAELEKVRAMAEGPRGTLRAADAGRIGTRAGKVVNRYKVGKHFELSISDGSFLTGGPGRQGRQRRDRARPRRPQLRRFDRRARHALPKRGPCRRGRAHLCPPDQADQAADASLRAAWRQASRVARARPARLAGIQAVMRGPGAPGRRLPFRSLTVDEPKTWVPRSRAWRQRELCDDCSIYAV